MFIYLVGPAGIGKTALARAVCDGKELIHIDLDNLVCVKKRKPDLSVLLQEIGAEGFWNECKKIIDETIARYQFHKAKILIDVGAAALMSEEARNFLLRQNTVLLNASAGEVFLKDQQKARGKLNYFDWEQREYSPERVRFYNSCRVKIDIHELSDQEVAQKFKTELADIEFRLQHLCPFCATELPEGESNCPSCGKSVSPKQTFSLPETAKPIGEGPETLAPKSVSTEPLPKATPAPARKRIAKEPPKSWPKFQISKKYYYMGLAGILAAGLILFIKRDYYFPNYTAEAKQNLILFQEAQKRYFEKNGRYALTFAELDWKPEKQKYYCFFLSPEEYISPPGWGKYPIPAGIQPSASEYGYLFMATANLDADPDFDVWVIKPNQNPEHLIKD